MKKLKQTLGKQQPKKQKPLNNYSSILPIGRSSHRSDINQILLYKSPNKTIIHQDIEIGLDNFIINIIENYVRNYGGISIEKIVKEIIERCQENQKFGRLFEEKKKIRNSNNNNRSKAGVENQELKKLQEIKQLVQGILDNNQKRQLNQSKISDKQKYIQTETHTHTHTERNNQLIHKFYEQLGRVIKNKNKITRKQKLQEYDRLIKLLSPRKVLKNQKIKQQQPIVNIARQNNFKVKVIKQEYQIKRQESHQRECEREDGSIRIGSQGKRVKTSGSSHSAFKSQNGHEKLKKLMQKQPSLKIIKTKVQYDYSAILQASKSKIQTRNKNVTTTAVQQGKYGNNNDITTKLNKAKKNQAFVFYRPKTGIKKEEK